MTNFQKPWIRELDVVHELSSTTKNGEWDRLSRLVS